MCSCRLYVRLTRNQLCGRSEQVGFANHMGLPTLCGRAHAGTRRGTNQKVTSNLANLFSACSDVEISISRRCADVAVIALSADIAAFLVATNRYSGIRYRRGALCEPTERTSHSPCRAGWSVLRITNPVRLLPEVRKSADHIHTPSVTHFTILAASTRHGRVRLRMAVELSGGRTPLLDTGYSQYLPSSDIRDSPHCERPVHRCAQCRTTIGASHVRLSLGVIFGTTLPSNGGTPQRSLDRLQCNGLLMDSAFTGREATSGVDHDHRSDRIRLAIRKIFNGTIETTRELFTATARPGWQHLGRAGRNGRDEQ